MRQHRSHTVPGSGSYSNRGAGNSSSFPGGHRLQRMSISGLSSPAYVVAVPPQLTLRPTRHMPGGDMCNQVPSLTECQQRKRDRTGIRCSFFQGTHSPVCSVPQPSPLRWPYIRVTGFSTSCDQVRPQGTLQRLENKPGVS